MALVEGSNIVVAVAGDVKDSITLEKVDKEPEIYVLPEVNERAEGVANWFSTIGDMDLKAPMEFPERKIQHPLYNGRDCRISGSAGSAYRGSELAMNMKSLRAPACGI